MRSAIATVIVALLAACTPMQWVKPETPVTKSDEDLSACRQEAWREARLHAPWFPRPLPYLVRDAQGRQVLVSPHGGFHDPFNDQFMEETRLINFCMRAKGYELVPVEKEATKK